VGPLFNIQIVALVKNSTCSFINGNFDLMSLVGFSSLTLDPSTFSISSQTPSLPSKSYVVGSTIPIQSAGGEVAHCVDVAVAVVNLKVVIFSLSSHFPYFPSSQTSTGVEQQVQQMHGHLAKSQTLILLS
jgi:hypothetical protein